MTGDALYGCTTKSYDHFDIFVPGEVLIICLRNLFREQCQNTSGLCSLSSSHRPARMFSFKFYSPKQTALQLIEYCWVLSYIDVTKKNLSDTTFINGVFLVLVMQCWGKVYIGTTEHIQNLAEELQNNLQPPSKDNFL